jgi:hypothetical protein
LNFAISEIETTAMADEPVSPIGLCFMIDKCTHFTQAMMKNMYGYPIVISVLSM